MANNNSDDTVHVSDYTRDDGTHVDDYYRAKPGGGSLMSENSSGNIDVPNTISNVLNSAGDGKSFEDECPALAKLFGSASKNEMNGVEEVPEVILKGGVTFIRIVLEKAVKVAKVAIEAIVVAAPVVAALYGAYKTGKAVYDNVSNFFSSKEAKTQVKTVNVAIQGLRETQSLQKKNIDLLVKQSASAKNQEEYSKLYEELAKQKSQYDKNNALLDKIEYSAQQQDYEAVANGLDEYMNNMNQIIDDSSTTLEGSVEKNDISAFDTSYFEQDLPYQFEDSHKSFDEAHKETYLTDELMNNLLGIQPASAEEVSYKPTIETSPDGGPMLKTGLSYNNESLTSKTASAKIATELKSDEVLSFGREFNDFIKAMGEDSIQGKKILKKVLKTYNSQFGKNIKASYQSELRAGVKKILNECMDSMKAMKLAGEIAEKVAPYLTWAYIFQKTYESYISKGLDEAKITFFKTGLEVAIILAVAEGLGTAGVAALPAFIITLIVEYALNLTGIFE